MEKAATASVGLGLEVLDNLKDPAPFVVNGGCCGGNIENHQGRSPCLVSPFLFTIIGIVHFFLFGCWSVGWRRDGLSPF